MYTVRGVLVDFSNAVGRPIPPVYIPRGYEIHKLPVYYDGSIQVFPFEMIRLMDACPIRFAFHSPVKNAPYWTVESNLRTQIPQTDVVRLINRVKRDMTRKKKAALGLGYYL